MFPPDPRIVRSPGVCGGEAYFDGTDIPVWVVEGLWRFGGSDADILANYPQLRLRDLAEARGYVAGHREEIEQLIRKNEAA